MPCPGSVEVTCLWGREPTVPIGTSGPLVLVLFVSGAGQSTMLASLVSGNLSYWRVGTQGGDCGEEYAIETVRSQLAAEEPELRRRGVRHLALFGSMARGEDDPDSDVDLAVEIEPGRSFSLIRMEDPAIPGRCSAAPGRLGRDRKLSTQVRLALE